MGVATTALCTKAFIPHLVGCFGMYWMKYNLSLKPIMDSSVAISPQRLYAALKLSRKGSINCLKWYSGSCSGCPLEIYLVLSFEVEETK